MNTNALCTAVAAKAAGVTGMRGASANIPDTLPAAPWAVVGSHQAVVDGHRTDFTFPIRVYVERTAKSEDTSVAVNDLVDAVVAAYRSGLTYGGTVAQGRIAAWNTDLYADVGGANYQVIEFTLLVTILDFSVQTP